MHVLAPEREQSACGHALTLHRPLRVEPLGERRFSVNGTPSDCVNLGVLGLPAGAAGPRPLGHQSRLEPRRRRDLFGHGLGGHGRHPARGSLHRGLAGLGRRFRGGRAGRAPGGHASSGERAARQDPPQRERSRRARRAAFAWRGSVIACTRARSSSRQDPARPPALLDRCRPAPVGVARGHRHGRAARGVRGRDAAAPRSDPPPRPRPDAGLVHLAERPAPPRGARPRREPRRPVRARAAAHGGRSARPAGDHGRARARRHAAGAASPVRGGGVPRAGLRRPSAAHRAGADDLPALHRRPHDLAASS